jgi:hypothetical protein
MNTLSLRLLSALAITTGAIEAANAATNEESPWTLSVFGGDATGFTGSLRTPEITSIPDLGVLDPDLAESSGSVTLNNVLYDDIFRHRHDVGFEAGYAINRNLEAFGRVTYEGLDGQNLAIGSLSSAALATPEPLIATFNDADSWGLALGARYYWPTSSDWRPFAGFSLGATRMDALSASLEVPGTGIDLSDVRFTSADTVFTQSVEGGIEYAPNRNFGMLFGLNAEHMGKLAGSHDPALETLGLDTTEDAEGRWSFPITLTASYRFGRAG